MLCDFVRCLVFSNATIECTKQTKILTPKTLHNYEPEYGNDGNNKHANERDHNNKYINANDEGRDHINIHIYNIPNNKTINKIRCILRVSRSANFQNFLVEYTPDFLDSFHLHHFVVVRSTFFTKAPNPDLPLWSLQ